MTIAFYCTQFHIFASLVFFTYFCIFILYLYGTCFPTAYQH